MMDDREKKGAQTQILHLFRTYYSGRHNKWGFAKRRGAYGFAFQGFNAPSPRKRHIHLKIAYPKIAHAKNSIS